MNKEELLALLEKNLGSWAMRKRQGMFVQPEILAEFEGMIGLYSRVRFLDLPFKVKPYPDGANAVIVEYYELGVEGGFIPKVVKLHNEKGLEILDAEHLGKKIPVEAYKN